MRTQGFEVSSLHHGMQNRDSDACPAVSSSSVNCLYLPPFILLDDSLLTLAISAPHLLVYLQLFHLTRIPHHHHIPVLSQNFCPLSCKSLYLRVSLFSRGFFLLSCQIYSPLRGTCLWHLTQPPLTTFDRGLLLAPAGPFSGLPSQASSLLHLPRVGLLSP